MKKFRSKKAMQAVLALVLGMSVVLPVEASYDITVPNVSGETSVTIDEFNSYDKMNIYANGVGKINNMNNGSQRIHTNGYGQINTLNGGTQWIGQGSYTNARGSINIMNGGYQAIYNQNYGSIETMNGGTQNIDEGSTGIVNTMNSGGQTINSGSTGVVNTMNGGYQRIYSGSTGTVKSLNAGRVYVHGTSRDSVINGGNMFFREVGAKIENLSINSGNLYLRYKDIDRTDFALDGDFKFAGGVVDMANEAVVENSIVKTTPKQSYETLNIDNFTQGGGTFLMNTDLASQTDSDKIIINNANANANATTYIEVKDKSKTEGTQVTGKKKLLLVKVNNGTANFAGKNINEGGLWQETPTIERGDMVNGEDGNTIGTANEWYLTNFVRAINEDTKVLLHRADNSYALWRNTSDSLRSVWASCVLLVALAMACGQNISAASLTAWAMRAILTCTSWVMTRQLMPRAPMASPWKRAAARPATSWAAVRMSWS